jgi:hypothetical protein
VISQGFYHQSWQDHTTVVLRKPGKSSYSAPNAYRPITLYSTLGKVLTAIMAEALTYVTEQFQLLPANHFGGRPQRSTSEALHYLTSSIKNVWQQKRVLSVLLLDISGTFPDAVTLQLLKNLRARQVPTAIVDFVSLMLKSRCTRLSFDNYTSEWIGLDNGIGQGDPMSMILYLFYSAGLLEVVKKNARGGETEDSEAWVDNTALFVATKSEKEGARRLVDIMEREGGAFDWSAQHNSKFDVPKFAYMCFTRRPKGTNRLVIKLRGKDIAPVAFHKHLGVVLDQALRWHQQADAAIAKATKWILLFQQLANTWRGMRLEQMRQLYMAVAVPKALYAADVWITPPSKADIRANRLCAEARNNAEVGHTLNHRSIQEHRHGCTQRPLIHPTYGTPSQQDMPPSDSMSCSYPRKSPAFQECTTGGKTTCGHTQLPAPQTIQQIPRCQSMQSGNPTKHGASPMGTHPVLCVNCRKQGTSSRGRYGREEGRHVDGVLRWIAGERGSGSGGGDIQGEIKDCTCKILGKESKHMVFEVEAVGVTMGAHMVLKHGKCRVVQHYTLLTPDGE